MPHAVPDHVASPQTLAVVPNMLSRLDSETVALGDIFLEAGRLVFIPYGAFRSSAPIVTSAAAALGGIVGAISNKLLDGSVHDATSRAHKARVMDWGMSVDARLTKHHRSIAIHRKDIHSFETEGGLAIVAAGQTHVFGYAFHAEADSNAAILVLWETNRLAVDASVAEAGIGITWPPPMKLLDSFIAGAPVLSSTQMESLSRDERYMAQMMDILGRIGNQKRRLLLEAWADQSESFKSQIERFLESKSSEAKRLPLISTLVFALGGIGIWYGVRQFLSAEENLSGFVGFAILFVSGFASLFAGISMASWVQARLYRRQLNLFAENPDDGRRAA